MPSEPDPSAAAPLSFFPAGTSPRPYSTEGRAAEEAIAAAGRVVEQILGDAPLLSLLATRGIGTTDVQRGAALHILAQQACEACQAHLGALDAAHEARASALAAARDDYRDFRRAVKAACAHDSVRDPLEAGINPRQTLRAFVVQATASYLAALKTVPPALIAQHGFNLTRTNAALARVQRLVVLDTLFNTRAREASRSARVRNRSVARLNAWTSELLDAVQRALGQAGAIHGPLKLDTKSRNRRAKTSRESCAFTAYPGRFALRFLGTPGG